MMSNTFILLLGLIGTSLSSCPEDFCLPIWTKATNTQETASVLLGEDEASGCVCREYPEFAVCFKRTTCHSFPKNINFTKKALVFKNSRIFEIKPGDLINLSHLETLDIQDHANLTRIKTGSFATLKHLKELSIISNFNLKILEKGCFSGLVNLKVLSLRKNAFVQLSEISQVLIDLPKLGKVDLSENNFYKITEVDFKVLQYSDIQELNLILCQIEDIEPKAFNHLTNLTHLRLGQNKINATAFAKVIEHTVNTVPLETLNLYNTGLTRNSAREILTAIAKTNIITINLAKNQFEVINSSMFPKMPNLKRLDLRESLVLNITNHAFDGLPNLKTLLLSGNKLRSIPTGVLLQQLTTLDLQLNSGGILSSSSFSVFESQFLNMKRLKELNLSFNMIYALFNTSFLGLESLELLGLKNASIYRIEKEAFTPLSNLLFLNLENNPLVKNHPLALEEGIFDGLLKLRGLSLRGCGVSSLSEKSFKNLKNLQDLVIAGNKLLTLPSFEVLPHLRLVDLSSNFLQPWQDQIFQENRYLEFIKVDYNKLAYLTDAMIRDFQNLTYLDLTNNPFACDCSFSWNDKKIMKLVQNQTIYCAFPYTTTTLTVSDFVQNNNHCQNLALIIASSVIFFSVGVVIFLIYYFRWHLRYWLFLTRLHLSRNRKIRRSEMKGYNNYVYDAFVSYSSDDGNFVVRLVTMLENYPPFIKLCVYERDFEVGTIISENILESVAKSRKTLLIISNSYAKSVWCRWESQIAEHHRLFFHDENGEYADDSLILIKLGPVNEAHMTPTLKYLLKTRIYLQWDMDEKKQKIFWEKLRDALSPPKEINENTHL